MRSVIALLFACASTVLAQGGVPGETIPGFVQLPGYPKGFYKEPKITSPPTTPGGKVHVQRHGPYNLRAGQTLNTAGTASNPCAADGSACYVTAFEADLEYDDGTSANINTGMWLHHIVMMVTGWSHKDYVCGGIPGFGRFFASGNERMTSRTDALKPYGRKMEPADGLVWIMELMNESAEARKVTLVTKMVYTRHSSYKDVAFLWVDATGCGASSVPAQQGVYDLKTPVWKSTITGPLVKGGAHVHDGGTSVDIYLNGKIVCTSPVLYNMRPEVVEPHDHSSGHAAEGAEISHISEMGVCLDFGALKTGDELYAIAHYNATKYPPMMHDGKAHAVMGIGSIWVGKE